MTCPVPLAFVVLRVRTYEPADFDGYFAFVQAANADNEDWVAFEDPPVMDRTLLKAPGYRRSHHFLLFDGGRLVADALATLGPPRGRRIGFVRWNALPTHRTRPVFDALLDRALPPLQDEAEEVRFHLRGAAGGVRDALHARGFERFGVLARWEGPLEDVPTAKGGRGLRPLASPDLPAVASLLAETFDEDPAFSLVSAEGFFGAAAMRPPDRGAYVVAVEADRVVGCAGGGLSSLDPALAVLDFLAVAKDARNRGLGAALLAETLAAFRVLGARRVRATADPDNAAAAGLYAAFRLRLVDATYRVRYRLRSEAKAA
jgi:ribosomal protein S18 acetylase RimI-like enzyme